MYPKSCEEEGMQSAAKILQVLSLSEESCKKNVPALFLERDPIYLVL